MQRPSDGPCYPVKIGDNRWIIEVRKTGGTEEQVINLPPGSIDQVGWDPDDLQHDTSSITLAITDGVIQSRS